MHTAKEANRLTKLAAERILEKQVETVSAQIQKAIQQGSFRTQVELRDMPDNVKTHFEADGYVISPSGGYNSTRYWISWEKVNEPTEKEAAAGLGALFGP